MLQNNQLTTKWIQFKTIIEMVNCPIKECGRKFENDETMLEHVRRRHPQQYAGIRQQTTQTVIDKEYAQQQELSKLPRLAKIMSKQKRVAEMPRIASSKGKKLQSANLSSIVHQSRQALGIDKSSIANRRPSLKKLVPASTETKVQRLPAFGGERAGQYFNMAKKEEPVKKQQDDLLTKTLPNFKQKLDNSTRKSLSRGKVRKSVEGAATAESKQSSPNSSALLRSTVTTLASAPPVQHVEKKKSLLRPSKKIQKISIDKPARTQRPAAVQAKPDFEQKIVVVKAWHENIFTCPSFSKVELLFLNNCQLGEIMLNELQSLRELSVTHNRLQNMQFLRYAKNYNIKVIHIDHNELTDLYMPPRLKQLTASFNKLAAESMEEVCACLRKSPELEELDLSFNAVRKANNYKLRVLAAGPRLSKLDGLRTTKIDGEMVLEFLEMDSKHRGLIPLSSAGNDRPSTAVSEFEPEGRDIFLNSKTIAQLEKEQRKYQKLIVETTEQLDVITQQNQIISNQLQVLLSQTKGMQASWDSASLLTKLQKQCECLELFNILQYADEEEIMGMIMKRKQELGIVVE